MAARGDVLALRRAVGFLPGAELDRCVVIQADRITQALDTVLVAPLDEAIDAYAALPGAVPVSPAESGTRKKQVVLLTQIATVPLSRFEPASVGRLTHPTRTKMDGVLTLVLDLA